MTWACGEVGLEGTRTVSADGSFYVGGKTNRTYASEGLKAHAGKEVRFHDGDFDGGKVMVWLAEPRGLHRAPGCGKSLGFAYPSVGKLNAINARAKGG